MRAILAVVAAVAIAGVAWAALGALRPGAQQPLAFNHKKHVDGGLECSACHAGIADGTARARLPELDVCLNCHGSEDNPKTKPLRDFAAAGKPVPWKQVYHVPEHVYFSHRRHVASAKLECAVCHGDMAAREAPVTRQTVPIRMERCVECHRERNVTTDCMACHR